MAQASNYLTFQQFITEGRDAPLYHSASWPISIAILSSGELHARTMHEEALVRGTMKSPAFGNSVWGMSFTRDYQYARDWERGLIFEVDQTKLTHRYPLYPVNFYRNRTNGTSKRTEYEEFLVFKNPIPLEPYLRKVYINKMSNLKTMEDIIEKWGIADPIMVDSCKKLVFDNPKFGGVR